VPLVQSTSVALVLHRLELSGLKKSMSHSSPSSPGACFSSCSWHHFGSTLGPEGFRSVLGRSYRNKVLDLSKVTLMEFYESEKFAHLGAVLQAHAIERLAE
jgi:hypothetical protein